MNAFTKAVLPIFLVLGSLASLMFLIFSAYVIGVVSNIYASFQGY